MFSLFDLLLLAGVPRVGPVRLRSVIDHFGGPSRALVASADELACAPGWSMELARATASFLRRERPACERFAERQIAEARRAGGAILTLWDDAYPERLRRIYDPPPFLFLRGGLVREDRLAIAVVGTRAPTSYGRGVAARFARECADAGFTVVSGLARGIDTAAHAAALSSSGRTIAVTGSGLDVPYPPENADLAERVSRAGAVITEYPMGTRPEAGNFPRRNRVISGLSLGTIVVESGATGGAMITARIALEQDREVFAVPGPALSPASLGCHALIRDGRAKLVEHLGDVLEELTGALGPLRPAGLEG